MYNNNVALSISILFVLQLLRVLYPHLSVGKILGIWLLFSLAIMPKESFNYRSAYQLYIVSLILITVYTGIIGIYYAGVSAVLTELFQSIIPIVYFATIKTSESYKDMMSLFVNWLIVVCVFSLFLFFSQPLFYREFLNSIENTGTDIPLTSNFFRSIFGLTLTGIFSLIGLVWVIETRSFSIAKIASVIILGVSLILAARKSGVILFLIYLSFYAFKRPVLIIISGLLLLLNLDAIQTFMSSDIVKRLASVIEGIEGRQLSWDNAIENFSLLGYGLGYAGHNNPSGSIFVPDNWYLKTLVEYGFFAFISIPLLLLSVFAGKRPFIRVERIILMLILVHSFTSNTLSFMFVLFVTGILLNTLYYDRTIN